jgi:hypothetical protein
MALLKRDKEEKLTEREKIEERREEVLARGRKFKYPLQYAKHKIVTLTVVISLLAIGALSVFGYFLLYKIQSTDDLLYRITQVIPVAVAKVDGENVRYSDYLMIYKSTITPIEKQGSYEGDEGIESMKQHYKRQALTAAEDYTYALKLARELKIKVTDEEVSQAIEQHRKSGGVERSEETFTRVLDDNFGLSMNEYRRMVYLSLNMQKVSEQIDSNANAVSNEVQNYILEGRSLKDISKELGDKVVYENTGGAIDRMNIDGGRSTMALTLEKGMTSKRFVSTSGSGYFFLTLIEKTDSTVNYESLEIPFTELSARLKAVRREGKVVEGIVIEDSIKE